MADNQKVFHIPRWEELPNIDLYMDQVVSYINDTLQPYFRFVSVEPITKSMVNNYVKARLVEAPVKKKYNKRSIALIIIVYVLKFCYSGEEIGKVIDLGLSLGRESMGGDKEIYNKFGIAIDDAMAKVFGGNVGTVDEHIEGREAKYLVDIAALSFATKFYVRSTFLERIKEQQD